LVAPEPHVSAATAKKAASANKAPTQKTRLRAQQRIQVQKPVRAWPDDGPDRVLKLVDISETGARVEGGLFAKAPAELRFEWSLVPGLKAETFHCKVIWRRGSLLGLRFRSLDERLRCLLRAMIRYHR
jgi:hypothetical protein